MNGMPSCDLITPDLDFHVLAQFAVEVCQRFVEQQHLRPADEAAAKRHPLLLAPDSWLG